MISPAPEGRSSTDGVRRATRRLLIAFAVLTALAVVQLLLRADVADRYWAWTIRTELTAAFLGPPTGQAASSPSAPCARTAGARSGSRSPP